MPRPPNLHGMLDKFVNQFASVVAARAGALLSRTRGGAVKQGRKGGRGVVRKCPFPGCRNAGKGPRNRWFCREHAASVPVREQKRILAERAQKGGAALVVKAKSRRASANKGRKLDMHCRVQGCKNDSRGPRFGFICDDHRKKLSAKEQRDAREKWKTAHAKKAA